MILLLHAFEIAAAHSSPAAVNKLLSRSPSVMQEPFCASHCLSSRGLHSPWKGSWGDIPWLCVLDEKVVYGSQGISGTFHGAALLGSFKSMYLVWSHFLKYHSQFLVFLFFFFRWCLPCLCWMVLLRCTLIQMVFAFFLRHPCLPLTLPPSWPGARMPFQAKPEKKSRHPKVVGVVDGIRENISQPGTIFLCTCHYLTKKEFIIVSPKDHTSSW